MIFYELSKCLFYKEPPKVSREIVKQDSYSIHVCLSGVIPNILVFTSTMKFDLAQKRCPVAAIAKSGRKVFGQQPVECCPDKIGRTPFIDQFRRIIMQFGNAYQLAWFMVSFVLLSSLITSLTFTDVWAESIFSQGRGVTRQEITIVLDPGHGGHDPGAIGPGDIKEKDVALSLTQAIKKRLSAHYNIVSTRADDYWIDIEERTAMANHHGADLLISIHTGGSFRHRASGLGTFYWSGEEPKGLRRPITAPEKWNAEEASLAWGSIQERHLSKSRSLAVRVHKELIGRLNVNDRGCQAVPLYVLAGADMPAILVEVGYVTHPAEEKQLVSPLFLDIVAEGLSRAITDFLQEE